MIENMENTRKQANVVVWRKCASFTVFTGESIICIHRGGLFVDV